ncbi:hypothetical protein KFE25_014355 [Diacronema lutheri]|uniref:Uncharacterized protein n=1 Tax=Diacronema lutheri TaxID=2081491 RepID=A0A8J5XAK3_DIALT|nr:hypothetical protein KFE25_014355 [Diacronema lutheri]
MAPEHAAPTEDLDGQRSHYEQRLSRLRGQNQQIINETVALKAKFRKSLQLLHAYQARLVQAAEPPTTARPDAGARLQLLAPGVANAARATAQPTKLGDMGAHDAQTSARSACALPHDAVRSGLAAPRAVGQEGERAEPAERQALTGKPAQIPEQPGAPQPPLASLSAEQLQQIALDAKRALEARSRAYEAWSVRAVPSDSPRVVVAQAQPPGPPVFPAERHPPPAPGAAPESVAIGGNSHAARADMLRVLPKAALLRVDESSSSPEGELGDISTPPARDKRARERWPPVRALGGGDGGGCAGASGTGAALPQDDGGGAELPAEPAPFEPRTTSLAHSPADVPRVRARVDAARDDAARMRGTANADGEAHDAAGTTSAEARASARSQSADGSRRVDGLRSAATGSRAPPAAENAEAEERATDPRSDGDSDGDSDADSLFDLIEALNGRGGGGALLDQADAPADAEPLRSLVELIDSLETARAPKTARARAGRAARAAPSPKAAPLRARAPAGVGDACATAASVDALTSPRGRGAAAASGQLAARLAHARASPGALARGGVAGSSTSAHGRWHGAPRPAHASTHAKVLSLGALDEDWSGGNCYASSPASDAEADLVEPRGRAAHARGRERNGPSAWR